jgi:hypothetical protein
MPESGAGFMIGECWQGMSVTQYEWRPAQGSEKGNIRSGFTAGSKHATIADVVLNVVSGFFHDLQSGTLPISL